MADVLARIVARKRIEVAERLAEPVRVPEATTRSLRAALARHGARFVMEVKRASPSGHRSAHSIADAARAYAPVADAISVLTDGADFGGSLADIATVRVEFDGPILAKDFIVDVRQVAEARAAGADAVLVMLSVLDDNAARAVLAEAGRFAMDAIVEVHDEAELARALAIDAAIIGINNRDLKTLATDLAVTERLAPAIPADRLVIAESGIASHADVERLAPLVDAFLVGSSLMAAPDIAEAARALIHGRVKLCGLTREADVALAAQVGASHAGFVFVPGTPRAVTVQQAIPLAAQALRLGLKPVGVFRDSDGELVAATARATNLAAVQLHGSESQTMIDTLRTTLPGVEVWAAADGADLADTRQADRLLFDNGSGGSGQSFDWRALSGHPALGAAFVAGGIAADNAAAAGRLGAYGIDVGSRVEASPGIKDPARVAAVFAALRPTGRGEGA